MIEDSVIENFKKIIKKKWKKVKEKQNQLNNGSCIIVNYHKQPDPNLENILPFRNQKESTASAFSP